LIFSIRAGHGKGFSMNHPGGRLLCRAAPGLILAAALLGLPPAVRALNPPQLLGQFAHTSWTNRDGYSMGAVFAMAQTPDGYLWLASQSGLVRFDGVKFTPWQPPPGQRQPHYPYSLLVSRDGTLWMGTFDGLVSWNGTELIEYPELQHLFVTSLLEDRDGTVWAGAIAK
jgi:ligand-binding sensor domain-containing protein